MLDHQNSLIGGGALLAVAIYAGASMYITGPLVVERMVQKSGWPGRCERSLKQEIGAHTPNKNFTLKLNCSRLLEQMGPEIRRMLETFGGEMACQLIDLEARKRELAQHLKANRRRAVLRRAASRCGCAVSQLIERKRLSIALHAGSARIITPSPIRNLESELSASLHAPSCTAVANPERAS